jgi:DHA1 family bicyclomycin/chloramphenicol resistance-like MFS transporter
MPRTRLQSLVLIVTLGFLNALTPFTIDMYLPAFPAIARDLGVPVSEMALTVSIYFIGYALGQLFYGPLLDRFGRKRPLYAGIGLYCLATLGCFFAQSLPALLFFRFLSACGGCSASVGATAMVRDFFPAKDAAKIFSMLMLVLSASPLLAPTAGSFVVAYFNWRTIFAILLAMGLFDILLVAFVLPRGAEPDHTVVLRLAPVWRGFREILRVRQFTIYAFAGALSFTGLFVYVASSPAIFLEGFHVSTGLYGAIFALLASGMIGGGQLNHLLARRFDGRRIFRHALAWQLLFACGFLAGDLYGWNGLRANVFFLFMILMFAGIASPNASALALEPFSKKLGSAAAMLGFTQLSLGAVISALVGVLRLPGSLPTAIAVTASSATGLVILWLARHNGARET